MQEHWASIMITAAPDHVAQHYIAEVSWGHMRDGDQQLRVTGKLSLPVSYVPIWTGQKDIELVCAMLTAISCTMTWEKNRVLDAQLEQQTGHRHTVRPHQ